MTRAWMMAFSLTIFCLAALAIAQDHPPYARSLYRHWIDADRDCQSTRVEVLVRDSRAGSLQFADDRGCTVELGIWPDPSTGNFVTIPGSLDVDHAVGAIEGRNRH